MITVHIVMCPIREVGWPILTVEGNLAFVRGWEGLVADITFVTGKDVSVLVQSGLLLPVSEWDGHPISFVLPTT